MRVSGIALTATLVAACVIGCDRQAPLAPQSGPTDLSHPTVAASTPTAAQQASIDVKPGSDTNPINCSSARGIIPVAILTTDSLDATTVILSTVSFEGAGEAHRDKRSGEPRRHEEDVDGDGRTDLVLHFRIGETNLTCASTYATLTGKTLPSGEPFSGGDAVRMVGGKKPRIAKPLLIIDDFRAEPDRVVGGSSQPAGAFPGESVLDSLMYAVGGFPYREEPLGRTASVPGVFAGFEYDTLDYRFTNFEGMPLEILSAYEAVVWIISAEDAGRRGDKFTSRDPMSALRFINTVGNLNTLGAYLSQGGKVWLMGDGVVPAIANGYVSRFSNPFARYPLNSGGDAPSQTSILWPGNFLYDFMHARSQIELNTRDFFPIPKECVDLIPYLPKHRTPGAPWPPVPGETPMRGPADDPRVGPSSERNLDPTQSAGGWGIPAIMHDLPQLTITTEWPDYPRRLPTSLDDISYISLPNFILEDHDNNPGTPKQSRLDTLYIGRARRQIIATRPNEPDGKPVFFYYWGYDHGPIAWTSVNLWMYERTQLQTLAEIILGSFGIQKNSNPSTRTGPGSAHYRGPSLAVDPY